MNYVSAQKIMKAVGGDNHIKDENTKQHLMNTIFGIKHEGGNGCDEKINKSIYAWTLQKYNANQKTLSKSLQGGRVTLPGEYFGNDCNKYAQKVKFTTMSDTTPAQTRPALNISGSGRKHNIVSKKEFDEMFHAGGLNSHDKKHIFKEFNKNIEKFTALLKGGDIDFSKPFTKASINNAFRELKKN